METAVAYIRVSSQKQVEGGSSLDTQEKQVRVYAEAKGYKLLKIFREEGESAKTDQRPVLQHMLQHCSKSELVTDVVIIPKIDRLARNAFDYGSLRLRLSKLRIRLESIGENIEDSPVGRFTETLLASVAQFDNEIRSERSRGGMVEAVSQGRWVWPAPYGYRNVRVNGKGTIEPHPDEAVFVAEAFRQLALGHQSAPVLFKRLQKKGLPLSRTMFYKMIENPVYLGKINSFGGTFEATPPFVALTTEEIAWKARRALRPSNNPQQYQLEREDFPLRGTATCACGQVLTGYWATSKSGKRHAYYRCMKCPKTNYPRTRVEGFFEQFLNGYNLEPQEWSQLMEDLESIEARASEVSKKAEIERIQRLAELEKLAESVALKSAAGVIPDEIAGPQLKRLASDIAELKAVRWMPGNETPAINLVSFASNFLGSIGTQWRQFSLELKKDLLRFMFPRGVLFDPENGFRTPGSSFLERVKSESKAHIACLVDREVEFSNTVRSELKTLCEISERH